MSDLEKVIKGLRCCTSEKVIITSNEGCYGCPYRGEGCIALARDALKLLEEQEVIVRCKDCVNCIKEPNGGLYCDVLAVGYEPLGSKKVTENWFCADGEMEVMMK